MTSARAQDRTDAGARHRTTPGVYPGRWTAEVSEPVVVFLIGMRVNRLRRLRQWWWVTVAMPRMIRTLAGSPELGLLHAESFFRGRTTLMVQYWRSLEDLQRFARGADLPHLPAWRRWNRALRDSGDAGIWHETYTVAPESVESVYGNMPLFGLAAATAHVPAGAG